MSRIIGIDLGTTNSLVAAVDSGIPFVVADPSGRRLTPSVIHSPGPGAAMVVGDEARRLRTLRPAETVYSVKRFIGRRGQEIPPAERAVPYQVLGDGAGPVQIELHGERYSPERLSAEILKKLRADAEACLGEPVTRAVITVPAYFNDAQRNATKAAGELAGLAVERILNEPTAAALAYGLDKLRDHARVAVYDLGGGTFDLSLLELREGVFQVLATHGNTRLGGDDLDRRVVEFLAGKIAGAGGPSVESDPVLLAKVREAAEAAKIQLSAETAAEITLPFLTPGFSFQFRLTRGELERLTRDILTRTKEHCLRALADAKLQPAELDQVILVGGQTRMPLVRKLVAEWFHCADFESLSGGLRLGDAHHRPAGPTLNTGQNPDEAIALGAAIQAEILAGGFKNLLLLDVTPLSLGLETFGGLMNVVIPRNTTIPVKAGEMFTTAVDNQAAMLIHVLQGERERARDNWSLGKFAVEFQAAARGIPRVGVQFEIDANGILHVLARDIQSGRETVVEMRSAVDVDDAEVQRMVEESVEHAFSDLELRRWVETKLRAQETADATAAALRQHGADLPPEASEAIRQALERVQTLVAAEDPATATGDAATLKAAHAALDEATLPLADLMMEQAMDAMLRKRGIL